MDCHQVGEKLSEFLDRELEASEAREVERHLDLCPDCRLHHQELERNRSVLAGMERLRPPDELYGRVLHEIRTGRHTTVRLPRVAPVRGAAWWSGRGLLAAAAALVLFCLLALTAVGYYADDDTPRVAARPVVNRHALDSGAPLLGQPPMWTAASYVPGRQGAGR